MKGRKHPVSKEREENEREGRRARKKKTRETFLLFLWHFDRWSFRSFLNINSSFCFFIFFRILSFLKTGISLSLSLCLHRKRKKKSFSSGTERKRKELLGTWKEDEEEGEERKKKQKEKEKSKILLLKIESGKIYSSFFSYFGGFEDLRWERTRIQERNGKKRRQRRHFIQYHESSYTFFFFFSCLDIRDIQGKESEALTHRLTAWLRYLSYCSWWKKSLVEDEGEKFRSDRSHFNNKKGEKVPVSDTKA